MPKIMVNMKKYIHIIFMIFGLYSCFSQTGKIEGKLFLDIPEEYDIIAKKTKVILDLKDRTYHTTVDDSLKFVFDSLPRGKFMLTLDPKPPGIYNIYEGKIKSKKSINLNIEYSISCKYNRSINDKTCPLCLKQDKVIPISYGLIIETNFIDADKNIIDEKGNLIEKKKRTYYPGGCIVSECDPNWYCEREIRTNSNLYQTT